MVTINISGLTLEGEAADIDREDGLGMITIVHDADTAYPGQSDRVNEMRRIWVDGSSSAFDEGRLGTGQGESNLEEHPTALGKYGVSTMDQIPYDNNGVITLVIIDPGGDGNWVDNSFSIDIESDKIGISANPGSYRVTVVDNDVQPAASFSKTSLALTEETATTVPVAITVGVPMGTKTENTPDTGSLTNNIRFTASPAGAVVAMGMCDPMSEDDVIAVTMTGITEYTTGGATDTWAVDAAAGATTGTTATIGIEACGDMTSFNDEMVTFSFVAMSLTTTPAGYGSLSAGPDLVVTVRSEGEAAPTVSFATTSIAIDEGETNTVAIIADGKLGPRSDR